MRMCRPVALPRRDPTRKLQRAQVSDAACLDGLPGIYPEVSWWRGAVVRMAAARVRAEHSFDARAVQLLEIVEGGALPG